MLVSEYAPGTDVRKFNFIGRNRIISRLSTATLITGAALKSGSLHTARFALEQGRDVLAVPGNINVLSSEGTNNLIKRGATPVTEPSDVLFALNVTPAKPQLAVGSNDEETAILTILARGERDGEVLLTESQLDIAQFIQTLTMLEISGKVRSLGANQWSRA